MSRVNRCKTGALEKISRSKKEDGSENSVRSALM